MYSGQAWSSRPMRTWYSPETKCTSPMWKELWDPSPSFWVTGLVLLTALTFLAWASVSQTMPSSNPVRGSPTPAAEALAQQFDTRCFSKPCMA